jgi:hypothetical protein
MDAYLRRMDTERPNTSTTVFPGQVRERALRDTVLLHGWRLGTVVGIATVLPGVAVAWWMSGASEAKVALVTALTTWGALGLVVGSEYVYRRLTSRGVILGERLAESGKRIGELESELRRVTEGRNRERAETGSLMADFYARGNALRRRIIASTDAELTGAQAWDEFHAWNNAVRGFLSSRLSPALAAAICDPSSVRKDRDIGGLRDGVHHHDKEKAVLHLDARLEPLRVELRKF